MQPVTVKIATFAIFILSAPPACCWFGFKRYDYIRDCEQWVLQPLLVTNFNALVRVWHERVWGAEGLVARMLSDFQNEFIS
jgi:hypothetical protein